MRSKPGRSERAKELRESQTEAEGLLWNLLRSSRLCELKFRRQHPIGTFFADFACQSHRVVIELDGEYHDHIQENDLGRERVLESQGWKVIRFTNGDVLKDTECFVTPKNWGVAGVATLRGTRKDPDSCESGYNCAP